jgi:type IV pilus assembly protein PilW
MKNKSCQTGMTLIEIMIALLIGAFLLGGVLQIFIISKQTNRMQEGLSRLQENGRFALDFLAKDIRMAGFIGCNSKAAITNTLNSPTNFLTNFGIAIEGFESTSTSAWTPTINAAITSPLGGSDVITIRRADDQSITVAEDSASNAGLTLDAAATIDELKKLGFLKSNGTNNCAISIVSNCSAAAVFQVSALVGSVISHATGGSCAPGNLTADLTKPTKKDDQVYPINTISYYVRSTPIKTDRAAITSDDRLSLYRKTGSNDAQEIVEGIETIQILYGEDTDSDGTPNYYVTANNVADMNKVVSIRINLTARTLENTLTTTGDGRIRRNFTSTIAVRNRL